MFNAIADGRATVERLLDSEDVRSTAACLRALGVEIEWAEGSNVAHVLGRGLHGLFESENVLDCGNSGTTMRLLAGLLSGHPLLSVLTGVVQAYIFGVLTLVFAASSLEIAGRPRKAKP